MNRCNELDSVKVKPEGRRSLHRFVVRPGVYFALKGGRFKSLANAYFWMVGPLVIFLHSKGL